MGGEGRVEAAAGVREAAAEVLDAGAGQDQLQVVRSELERLVQSLEARFEPAGACQREGERAQELAAVVLADEPERGRVPVRRGGRRLARDALRGAAQDRD